MTFAAQADPGRWAMEGWKTDFSITSINLARVLNGGPPRDGIPSIDDPQFKPYAEIDFLIDTEPVIGLVVNGEAKAYPLRIFDLARDRQRPDRWRSGRCHLLSTLVILRLFSSALSTEIQLNLEQPANSRIPT